MAKAIMKKRLARAIGAGLMGSVLVAGSAFAFVIDFEEFTKGTIVTTQMAGEIDPGDGVGVTVSADNFFAPSDSDLAVVFDSAHPSGGDSDLGAPFWSASNGAPESPGKILILEEFHSSEPDECDSDSCDDPDDEGRRGADVSSGSDVSSDIKEEHSDDFTTFPDDGTGVFNFTFTKNIYLESIDFYDIESEEDGDNNARIRVYDSLGTNVAFQTFDIPHTGDHQGTRKFLNIANVRRLEIVLAGSGAVDNIIGRMTSVSEPGMAGLFAFGLLGLFWRRRRSLRRAA